jgi:uncharacterized damage-inducible protein DinB
MLFSSLPHTLRQEDSMTISEILLPEFDREMANTRKMLELVPDGKFDYKPHEKSMELGRLASHIAEFPSWASHTFLVEVLDLPADAKPHVAQSRKELLEIFDKAVPEARAHIEKATDADWQKIWTLKFAGRTLFSRPRTDVMRDSVISHLIHHRAQLGVYLRLNDIEFPGMYGPSADEMKNWKTQGT